MKRSLAETVVDFLGFHTDPDEPLAALEQFNSRKWKACLPWLHDAGLALYFLQKLKDQGAANLVPEWVFDNLERSFEANRQRNAMMAEQFRIMNRAFDESGVHYAVVKGFSLVPDFCPDINLRPLSDLDYLVEPDSVPAARAAIERNGYSLKELCSAEIKFISASAAATPQSRDQYSAQAPHAVELHLALWDTEARGFELAEPTLSGKTEIQIHNINTLSFPGLPREDVFILQVVHAFNHILSYWVRMSSIYEIGYFLNCRGGDDLLWSRLQDRAGRDPLMNEAIALVVELSARFFAAPRPPVVARWAQDMRPAVKIWTEQYAKVWIYGKSPSVFCLFPPAKLAIFLHQQYVPVGGEFVRTRLFAKGSLSRLAEQAKVRRCGLLHSICRRKQVLTRKGMFHLGAGIRYLWETRRWRRISRGLPTGIPARLNLT